MSYASFGGMASADVCFKPCCPFSHDPRFWRAVGRAGPEGGEGVKAQVHPSRWTIQNSILKGVERDSNASVLGGAIDR